MTRAGRWAPVGLSVLVLSASHCGVGTHSSGDTMAAEYTVITSAAGASRLYAGSGSTSLVAEHRDWLREAYHERAAEAPGVVKLLGPDGALKRIASGWALGGAVGTGEMAWVEEVGDEYHYQVVRSSGAGSPLAPPDDYWAVAGAVGHPTSPLGAVVLWRPVRGASARDPAVRRDELWIAAIDRTTGTVLKTRDLSLTLPWERVHGVLMGGPAASPMLLLVGLPDPGGPGQYRLVGLQLPTLDVAWDLPLDVGLPVSEPTPSSPHVRLMAFMKP